MHHKPLKKRKQAVLEINGKISSRTTVNETGGICLKIKLFEKEKERNARRRVILKNLRVVKLLNDIPQYAGTSLFIPRFTTAQVMHTEV
jgi:hypothetical protein